MTTVDYIKGEIKRLYENDPDIHINVKGSHPRLAANAAPATITGVYSNVFCVLEADRKPQRTQTYQYADVLIGRVEISELDYFPPANKK